MRVVEQVIVSARMGVINVRSPISGCRARRILLIQRRTGIVQLRGDTADADARPLIVADVRRSALFNEQDGPAAIFEDGRLVAGRAVRVHALITDLPVYP